MRFKHTNRPGFWLGFIDFFTAGLFFLLYMPLGGLQDELDEILGRRTQRYWMAYLLGIPTLFTDERPCHALLPYDSNSLTAAEMVRPSDCPARALFAALITLPMSLMEVAPT